MMEIINNPAFLPSLFGFLAGLVLISLISSIRGRLARSAARTQAKVASEKLEHLKSERSALETEIATMRSNEARLMKRQGELEALSKTEKAREAEIAGFETKFASFEAKVATLETKVAGHFEKTNTALQTGFKAQEKTVLQAIKEIPQPRAAETVKETVVPIPVSSPPPLPNSAQSAEDLDFVPQENLPSSKEEGAAFEGFAIDQSSLKAESAANAFRAALTDDRS